MTPFTTLQDIKSRSAEAVIAQSGLSHQGLKDELRVLFSGARGADSGLLAEPVMESAHPYIPADVTLSQVPPEVLDRRFIDIVSGLPETDDYRFPAVRKPFRHQYAAWQALSDHQKPQSVLVTSGTGSGKTECFLFPVLSELTRQAANVSHSLEGIQAIMLYPLNALIESQKLRLSAWTRPMKGKVRYALYNGDMPQSVPASKHRDDPERVPDRETLRASPPPILVTNITMLEYMLARIEDQPIIEKSRGKLKWIVLDEAHSLVGAAAAEIALLLRRVLLAFDVKPSEVHFVATSATIGDGDDILQRLKSFLAEIGGISDDQVHVIEGARQLPVRPASAGKLPDLKSATPEALYDGLGGDPDTWSLIERLFKAPQPLSAFSPLAQRHGLTAQEFISELTRAERAQSGETERLAPMRVHAFERSVPGLWACLNPACGTHIAGWPFGRLFSERAQICPDCQGPVLEMISCTDCGIPMLSAAEGKDGRLISPNRQAAADEFALEAALETDAPETDAEVEEGGREEAAPQSVTIREHYLFSVLPSARARTVHIDLGERRVVDQPGDGVRAFRAELHTPDVRECPCCEASTKDRPILRPLLFGAPFMIGTAAPLLLEGVAPKRADQSAPFGGRGLLSFTDSRQGTARLSAKLQAESERNFVRSFIYHSVQNTLSQTQAASPEAEALRADLLVLEPVAVSSPRVAAMVEEKQRKLQTLSAGNAGGIAWPDLVDRLAERIEIQEWISDVWEEREPEHYSQPRKLAELLILREFDRRPRRATSLETLGLARLRFPLIDDCGQMPPAFARRGKSLQDWKDYLYGIVTHFIRANRAVDFAGVHRHWLMPHVPLKGLLPPGQKADNRSKHVSWPHAYATKGTPAWPILVLVRGLSLDRFDAADRQDISECLEAAWNRLSPLLGSNPDRRGLDFNKAFIAPVTRAFVCPDTRRLIDVAPFGLTPYGRHEPDVAKLKTAPLDMPAHPSPKLGQFDDAAATQAIRAWLADDPVLQGLRAGGQWNNISDRVAGFAHYTRSAEHSAQQQNTRLRIYEDQFKDGRINILNCSTTMEMGVDIGSVSTVMMTNVPPSIANYRQRVGRAGRRGQAVSLSFTYCKDRPLDREAFTAPVQYLMRKMAPPKVALSSRTIVQRHVNAYLLRAFLQARTGDALRMQIGAFMGCPSRIGDTRPLPVDRPVAEFIKWLGLPDTRAAQAEALKVLVRRSVLEGEIELCEAAGIAMTEVEQEFVAVWRGFQELAREEGGQAKQSRMAVELKRLCEDFLLSALADQGFLPGHGFPNHVVTFIPARLSKATEGRDGARQHRALGPQRSLDLAIRDYAPGSEVVLDGLVHKSAGVTLNWKRPASEEKITEVQSLSFHWHCKECGASASCKSLPEACAACGSTQVQMTEYLRPAGFSVDPREKAHANTDTVQYVPAEIPRVSTRNAAWRALPWPDTGRLRLSRNGRVFYGNFGPERRKYALCLHCGRAEAEPADGSNPLAEHAPLRWGKIEDIKYCQGNTDGWKIRRSIALGHEISTDVIEIQLAKPLSEGGVNALAISLRESLARELGVEADEMGFATHQIPGPYAVRTPSVLLFDKASGGAGFSISLENMLASVLKGCEGILDCRTPGCVTGCAACVLTADAPAQEDGLDRIAALEYLRNHLLPSDDLPAADRFVPEARLSVSVLNEIEEILPRLTKRHLLIYAGQDSDPSGLTNWPALTALSSWVRRGYPVTMVLDPLWLEQLDILNRQNLRDLALKSGMALATGVAQAGSGAIFAVVSDASQFHAWASRDPATRAPGSGWGQPHDAPIAKGMITSLPEIAPINLDDLKPRPGAKFHPIAKELDQMMDRWGVVMARQMADQLKTCNIQLAGNIRKIVYSDSYVRSPMVARLLLDTIAALQTLNGQSFSFELVTQLLPMFGDRGPPRLLTHNWPSEAAASDVLHAYASSVGVDMNLSFQKAPHGRYLNFHLHNGRGAQIILDQGFGAWSLLQSLDLRHNFQNSPQQQVQAIKTIKGLVQRQSYERSYMVAVAE